MFRNALEPLKAHSRNTHIIKTKKLKMFLNSFHYMQFSPTFGVTLMGLLSGVSRALSLYDSVKSAKCCCQPKTNSDPKQEATTLSKALKTWMYGRPLIYISTEHLLSSNSRLSKYFRSFLQKLPCSVPLTVIFSYK